MPAPKRNIIVVAASSVGVEQLCELNEHLPKEIDASIFVVLHVGSESLLPDIPSRQTSGHARAAQQTLRARLYLPSHHRGITCPSKIMSPC
jgi:chemotaxis response regulator CheB